MTLFQPIEKFSCQETSKNLLKRLKLGLLGKWPQVNYLSPLKILRELILIPMLNSLPRLRTIIFSIEVFLRLMLNYLRMLGRLDIFLQSLCRGDTI
jgi:hypothetical protein